MLIALAILCALLESVFTALEIALGAVSRARLRQLLEDAQDAARETNSPLAPASEKTVARIARALKVLDDAPRTTLLFITVTSLSLWAATSLLTWQALRSNWPAWALPAALIGVLFLAEVLPVLIAAPRAESLVLRGSGLVQLTSRVLAPLLLLIGGGGRGLARLLGARANAAPQVTEEELRTALAAAEEEGAIESGERALLEGAMDFRSRIVREVMTTRREIVAVPASAPLGEVLRTAIEAGHSRLPVYDGSLDKILGIASTKDLIPHLRHGFEFGVSSLESNNPKPETPNPKPETPNPKPQTVRAADIVRPPFFVPETKRIAPTLEELRRQRSLMALVVDDDGATVGLVTLEDLLEEIVGDIQDEYDTEEPELRIADASAQARCIAVDGSVPVREVERFWEKTFGEQAVLRDHENQEADDTISLAAHALQLFEGVPGAGDRIAAGVLLGADEDETGALEIEIARMDGPRIEEVLVRRAAQTEDEAKR
jgi:CBS domain containing-hemolysin-like protein